MSQLKILSAVIILAFMLPACSRRTTVDQAPELSVELEIVPAPPRPGSSTLIIQISDENGTGLGELTLAVRGDMSHAGMGPILVDAVTSASSLYSVPFEWSMAGDWVLTISSTLADGRRLIRTLPVRVEP
ncbi:MAG: hypothetical protein E4G99_07240 [Anaerolineales bacterium]|nr:MAG: hypothetical protein E4G99_07240 [Anaerolineales bacterium]